MKGTNVIRVIEFDGDFLDVAPHMSRQAEVRALEAELDPYLAEPRDMTSPEGARRFFAANAMRGVISRRSDR
jgi:hypothetical protein